MIEHVGSAAPADANMRAVLLRMEAEDGPRGARTVVDGTVRRLVQRFVPRIARRLPFGRGPDRSKREIRWASGGPPDDRATVLLVSHDLSRSGAPKVLLAMAELLLASGYGVVVVAPGDGPLSAQFSGAGATIVLDPALDEIGNATLSGLGFAAAAAFCNTVVTVRAVRILSTITPTIWYLHEVSLIEALTRCGQVVDDDFRRAHELWCGSEQSARLVRERRRDVRVVAYGVPPLRRTNDAPPSHRVGGCAQVAVFGSFEVRKGQDLAIDAVRMLDPRDRSALHLTLYGRSLDADFHEAARHAARGLPVTFGGELDAEAYRDALLDADIVLVSSRDDTLPLVSLDALGAGRVLACTPTTGTSAYLRQGDNGFVARDATAAAIAGMLSAALAARADWQAIGARAETLFAREFSAARFAKVVIDSVEQARVARGSRLQARPPGIP